MLFLKKKIFRSNIITKAYGNESIWYYLDNKEHYILNINLHEEIISTQLHYLEFIHSVPYRYKKFFNGYLVDWDGKKKIFITNPIFAILIKVMI